jgi:hypothetical protein
LDDERQRIFERHGTAAEHPVAVIPLPFASPKMRKAVQEFTKGLWPKTLK